MNTLSFLKDGVFYFIKQTPSLLTSSTSVRSLKPIL